MQGRQDSPGARPACRGTPETTSDNTGCSLQARTEVVIVDVGVRFRARTKLCAQKTVIPWTIIYVFNVGMIRG